MLHSGIIQKTGDSLKCSFVCFWSSKAYEGGHHVTACASLCRLGSLLTGQIRTFDSLSNCSNVIVIDFWVFGRSESDLLGSTSP